MEGGVFSRVAVSAIADIASQQARVSWIQSDNQNSGAFSQGVVPSSRHSMTNQPVSWRLSYGC